MGEKRETSEVNQSRVYFPVIAHTANPVVLLQIAVKLDVDVLITKLVDTFVPSATKKRLLPISEGTETPD